MLLVWILVFVVSLVALVKGADWLLKSAEKIGLAIGLSSFVVGVVIVGLGTSFPELISSIAAVMQGAPEIVTANAIGSNIANILLIVGIASVIGGKLAVSKNLIDLDIPLLAISTVLFMGMAWDREITLGESILLLTTFIIYLLYTAFFTDGKEKKEDPKKMVSSKIERRKHKVTLADKKPEKSVQEKKKNKPKITAKDILFLIIGIICLVLGAQYLVQSVIELSVIIGIGTGIIALVAVAFGTSLPELMVSVKAALNKKPEVALGNVFGSNVFNLLFVIGLPGLFKTLKLDEQTYLLALPVLIVATFLFIISGISRRIHVYEGAMYLVIYLFFVGKLFGII